MSNALKKIDAAIALKESELAELRKARALMVETLELRPDMPEGTKSACLEMEVAGRMVSVGTKPAVVLQMLAGVDDVSCVPLGAISGLVDGNRKTAHQIITRLRKTLKAANVPAEIVNFYGEGYRLQVKQDAA